ncbi:MAG: TetR/AcrR family transcriptional regulator [Hyphomonadaceae bacterium]|nr:MAG: TetR family transcriptional regulator [Caulobacteraceae bacterium]MBT9445778.1 TetR/AcrR family transcriptional regulator [Hyphomonadaceae bacterium]TPW06219.1 MAG: TetR family transcriptional regulator [Alphaproteobacteria bacterium]
MARLADPALAQRRRREIVEAAMTCFRKRGFHQASMHEICAAAGISAGALYRYFPSKADIILTIAEEDQRATEALIESIAAGADITESLVNIARDVVCRCGENQPLTADVLAEAMRDPALAKRFAGRILEMQERLARAIAAGQRRGSVERSVDPDTAARLVTLMIDGLVLRAAIVGAEGGEQLAAAFRTFVERVLKPAQATSPRRTARLVVSPES